MKRGIKFVAPLAIAMLCVTPPALAADGDATFNREVGGMIGQDTGSGWFNYYVATVNQQIAYQEATEAYGAAGPNGPLKGFDGYLGSFVDPDTGTIWFNDYVDDLNRDLAAKGY